MKLGSAKTFSSTNVVEASVKPDKIAGIELQDLGQSNAKTLQKKLLRLHAFGRRYPNSGALRRLVGELHTEIADQNYQPSDLMVQVAIATDIAIVSPLTFPAIAGILSHLISLAPTSEKTWMWGKVHRKLSKVPNNGYLEIWLQRVTKPKAINIHYESEETICKVINGKDVEIWNNSWISNKALKNALKSSQIVVKDAGEASETIPPKEVELFTQNAWSY